MCVHVFSSFVRFHVELLSVPASMFVLVMLFLQQPPSLQPIHRSAGDVLQIALPVAAAGMTLSHWDEKGAIQLAESASSPP